MTALPTCLEQTLGPTESRLGADEVVVFLTPVQDSPLAGLQRVMGMLSREERERAGQLLFERDRNCFVIAHALLRRALAWATGSATWRFVVDYYGKPELPPCDGAPPLRFNISH